MQSNSISVVDFLINELEEICWQVYNNPSEKIQGLQISAVQNTKHGFCAYIYA